MRDRRVDIMRGAALLMIFIDHSTGNVFSHFTLQNLQFCDASEIFFLLSGYSCMAAYGGRLDRGEYWSAAKAIARRCLTIYLALILTLIAGEMLVAAMGLSEPIDPGVLQTLAGVHEPHFGVAASELFRPNSWPEFWDMVLLVGEPKFFDILRPYIVLIAVFPLMWLGLRRAPVWTFAVSVVIWLASRGAHGLHFYDPIQEVPWAFNPFGWQAIVLSGAGMRVVLAKRGNLPQIPALTGLSLCIVAAGFAFKMAYVFGFHAHYVMPPGAPGVVAATPPDTVLSHAARIMLTRENLAPLRWANALALFYLAMSRPWRPWPKLAPTFDTLGLCGRHSLLIFSAGLLASEAVDLLFIKVGQGWAVQMAATAAGLAGLPALAAMAEQRRRAARPVIATG